jgi:hypothetical protein
MTKQYNYFNLGFDYTTSWRAISSKFENKSTQKMQTE